MYFTKAKNNEGGQTVINLDLVKAVGINNSGLPDEDKYVVEFMFVDDSLLYEYYETKQAAEQRIDEIEFISKKVNNR